MPRKLTKKQMKALQFEFEKGANCTDDIDDYKVIEIEQMNWYETFIQDANRFLTDLYFGRLVEGGL
jgi:hypothetical protein